MQRYLSFVFVRQFNFISWLLWDSGQFGTASDCRRLCLFNNRPVGRLSVRTTRGTGMIASSSTFRPHPGRVIRDLFRLLDAVTAKGGASGQAFLDSRGRKTILDSDII